MTIKYDAASVTCLFSQLHVLKIGDESPEGRLVDKAMSACSSRQGLWAAAWISIGCWCSLGRRKGCASLGNTAFPEWWSGVAGGVDV
jgi:hypothetical protein